MARVRLKFAIPPECIGYVCRAATVTRVVCVAEMVDAVSVVGAETVPGSESEGHKALYDPILRVRVPPHISTYSATPP